MELESKHIAPYLPYSLKLVVGVVRANLAYISTKNIAYIEQNGLGKVEKVRWVYSSQKRVRPILNPLSEYVDHEDIMDEFSDISLDHFEARMMLDNYTAVKSLSFEQVQLMLKHHLDIFGLIEKGLAININDIK